MLREDADIEPKVAELPAAPVAEATRPGRGGAASPVAADATTPGRRGRRVMALAVLAALAGGGGYGWHYWTVGRFEQTTDDAFLQADKVTVAPRVTGYVAEVLAGDNQPVKAGDVLARIDDRDYRIAFAQADADVEKAKAEIEGVKAAIIHQVAQIEQAKADVANAEAGLTFATQESRRYGDLLHAGAGTTQRAQQADADLRQRTATLAKSRASLDAAQKQVASLQALQQSAAATLAGAGAKREKAQLDIGYTVVRAPIDGVVGDRAVRLGQLVQPGVNLLTLVPTGRDIYLVANFKETQLGDMIEGEPVDFTVDAFGDHVFHGSVDSLAPGTGSQFALLPPENATGNFTKVVQRVPVKIHLSGEDPLLGRLRPGLSAVATVETRDARRRPNAKPLLVGEATGL